ncbi:beta-defensin 37-like [Grammomys surdaster]|uniref:beta-defensin 37-like n=1 Tax=Grammomys surdaster TaxID=491861 RepID=UPI00109F674F|nr:beta-defensin 37-like [Grammomys surdaster]
MKISCFLLLILSLSCFQNNPVARLDTNICIENKDTCHMTRCPCSHVVVGTCFEGKGKCCHKHC